LLIEDSAPLRQTLARLLRVAGQTVWEAETGAAGLALLRQQPLDLVVTDRDLPGLTGEDVARLLKVTYPHLPVVLVTGGADPTLAGRREPAGVDAVLRKPFQFKELLALIDRLTGDAAVPVARRGSALTGRKAQGPFSDTGRESGASDRLRHGPRRPRDTHRGGAAWRPS
jgi:CheY-like chemotaxis protein